MNVSERKAELAAQNLDEIAWVHIEENEDRESFEKELHLEVGIDHVLFGKHAVAGAVSTYQDDVLFIIDESEFPYAVVHLTYNLHPEPAPWPTAGLYHNIQDFLKDFI